VVSFTPLSLYLQERASGIHWNGEVKILAPIGIRTPDLSVFQPADSRYADFATAVLRYLGNFKNI
jgi:hypothetical protein